MLHNPAKRLAAAWFSNHFKVYIVFVFRFSLPCSYSAWLFSKFIPYVFFMLITYVTIFLLKSLILKNLLILPDVNLTAQWLVIFINLTFFTFCMDSPFRGYPIKPNPQYIPAEKPGIKLSWILGIIFISSVAGIFVGSMFVNALFFPPIMLWLWILVGLMENK